VLHERLLGRAHIRGSRDGGKVRRNIEEDWSWGFVAWGNDESHLNRYFVDHPPKTLPPAYWWPEALWVPACYTPWRNRIIAVRKDNDEFRSKPF